MVLVPTSLQVCKWIMQLLWSLCVQSNVPTLASGPVYNNHQSKSLWYNLPLDFATSLQPNYTITKSKSFRDLAWTISNISYLFLIFQIDLETPPPPPQPHFLIEWIMYLIELKRYFCSNKIYSIVLEISLSTIRYISNFVFTRDIAKYNQIHI